MTTRQSPKISKSTERAYIIYSPDYIMRDPEREKRGFDTKYVPIVDYNSWTPMSNDNMKEYTKKLADKGYVYDRLYRPVNSDYIDKHSRFYQVSVPLSTYKRTLNQIDKKTLERSGIRTKHPSPKKHPDWGLYHFEVSEGVMADLARKTRARRRRSGRTSLRF